MTKTQNRSVDDHINEIDEVSDDITDVRWMDIPVLVILSCLFLLVIAQTIMRPMGLSIVWSDEVARILIILFGFIGSITCVRKGSHIFLQFFYRYIPRYSIKSLLITTETISALFWGYLGYWTCQLALRIPSSYATIDLPKSAVYWVVSSACVLMVLMGIFRIFKLKSTSADDLAEQVL